jgi:hypothetical protein
MRSRDFGNQVCGIWFGMKNSPALLRHALRAVSTAHSTLRHGSGQAGEVGSVARGDGEGWKRTRAIGVKSNTHYPLTYKLN